jgi:hypothetical protein
MPNFLFLLNHHNILQIMIFKILRITQLDILKLINYEFNYIIFKINKLNLSDYIIMNNYNIFFLFI